MLKRNKIVRSLIDWLTGGVSTRLDFLERDITAIEQEQRRMREREAGVERVLVDHHERLAGHDRRLDEQTAYLISLRKMHGALAARVGQAFPGKTCGSCGAPMVFDRSPAEKAYKLTCAKECGERLLLPEAQLLESFVGRES